MDPLLMQAPNLITSTEWKKTISNWLILPSPFNVQLNATSVTVNCNLRSFFKKIRSARSKLTRDKM